MKKCEICGSTRAVIISADGRNICYFCRYSIDKKKEGDDNKNVGVLYAGSHNSNNMCHGERVFR